MVTVHIRYWINHLISPNDAYSLPNLYFVKLHSFSKYLLSAGLGMAGFDEGRTENCFPHAMFEMRTKHPGGVSGQVGNWISQLGTWGRSRGWRYSLHLAVVRVSMEFTVMGEMVSVRECR